MVRTRSIDGSWWPALPDRNSAGSTSTRYGYRHDRSVGHVWLPQDRTVSGDLHESVTLPERLDVRLCERDRQLAVRAYAAGSNSNQRGRRTTETLTGAELADQRRPLDARPGRLATP